MKGVQRVLGKTAMQDYLNEKENQKIRQFLIEKKVDLKKLFRRPQTTMKTRNDYQET